MYKKILVPTDGSTLSKQAVSAAVLFAKNIDAEIVGVCVIPAATRDLLEAWAHHDPAYAKRRGELYQKSADESLSFVANSALAEEVPCTCKTVTGGEPYRGILDVAGQTHCDLIYMASHGWQANAAQMLGSETLKVVTHSKIPVLVHKPEPSA